MRSVFLSSILIITIFTMNFIWAENLPPSSSLQVEVLSSYSYKSEDGTTIVLGEVENNLVSPINSVIIGVTFMDDNSKIIEYKIGTTLLKTVPAGGKTLFSISSTTPDQSITQIQVKIGGFRSSSEKEQVLEILPGSLQVSDKLTLSGTLKNNGAEKSLNTTIYLISYDAFQRVIDIGTSSPIEIDAGKDSKFNITTTFNPRANSYMLVAESEIYQSKLASVDNIRILLPVIVNNTVVTDPNGTTYSSIPVNSHVKITSNIKYFSNFTQSFVYYVQVKQFGGKVDFIGKSEGIFVGASDQSISVTWTPHSAGSYYVETFIWNSDSIPLSSSEPRINLALVK